MKTKPFTFLLALIFMFLFSGSSVVAEERQTDEFSEFESVGRVSTVETTATHIEACKTMLKSEMKRFEDNGPLPSWRMMREDQKARHWTGVYLKCLVEAVKEVPYAYNVRAQSSLDTITGEQERALITKVGSRVPQMVIDCFCGKHKLKYKDSLCNGNYRMYGQYKGSEALKWYEETCGGLGCKELGGYYEYDKYGYPTRKKFDGKVAVGYGDKKMSKAVFQAEVEKRLNKMQMSTMSTVMFPPKDLKPIVKCTTKMLTTTGPIR